MRPRTLAVVLAVALMPLGARAAEHNLASHVDPMIGTLGSGFVFPGPAAPYGMVQLSPDTEGFFAYTGYMWIDQFIRGFSHVHVESMGVPSSGNLPFMPTSGPVLSTDVMTYQSKFSHATEEASAGYYKVLLETYGVTAELTAGERVGMHRYTFPPGQANVLLDIGRQIAGGGEIPPQRIPGTNLARVERVDGSTVVGSANIDRTAPDRYTVHFAARFDRPMSSFGVWSERGGDVDYEATEVEAAGAGAVATFDATDDRDVVVEVGVSFVSPQNALENLDTELDGAHFDFDGLRARTRAAWHDALSVIQIGPGALPTDLRSFYTALYHAQHHPNVFNDVNGEYIGHDNDVHVIGEPGDPMPAGSTYYANFSMWDTYRAEMPLLMLIAPERVPDMMRSIGAIVRHSGEMPRWALMNRSPNFMNGEPGLQVFADAFCRGLVPEDSMATLYDEATRIALEGRRHQKRLYGYTTEASNTLEYALGDFALALVADRLGDTETYDEVRSQSEIWEKVFDSDDTRFVRPRDPETGAWKDPYYPEQSSFEDNGFREGTGWQYTWLVPHDVARLYDAMGGDETVTQRLDTFFSAALTGTQPGPEVQQKITLYGIGYAGNQYAPSNEHDLQAPWMYNWTSQPWKTQAIQRAYQSLYRAAPDGLPGNDDLGTMSAWFVWSALGFYPVTPGSPTYTIGSPMFEHATIRTPDGGTFTVEAPGASNAGRFVQSIALDGEPLERSWFTHAAFRDGGLLRAEMDSAPNLSWATGPGAAPPSASDSPPPAFACGA